MKWFVLVFLIGSVVQAEIHSPRPEIFVQSSTEVTAGKPIRVMDIATIGFVGTKKASHALKLQVLPAISDGASKQFANAQLVRILKEKISTVPEISDAKWTYFVPETVTLTAKKNLLPAQAIYNQITERIQAHCEDCKITLKDVQIPLIRESAVFDSCDLQTDAVKMGGSFLVPVQCAFGAVRRTYWISGTAKIQKVGPVAARQINPGDKITDKDFRMDDVDMTYAKDSTISPSEINGQVAARMIFLNQPIFKSDLKREPAIQKDQIIKAVSGNESFEITSQAVAEEQGYVGDMIKIKNSDSQKTLSGLVVEKGVVKVQ